MNNQSEDRVLGYVGTYPVGDYNEQTEYEYLNVVTHKGSSYVCIKEEGCIAVEPPSDECWQLLAEKGDTGEKGEKGDIGPIGPMPENGIDYNTNAEREEFKNAVVADSKTDLEKYIAEKETQLDNYTKEKETKLDDYVTDAVKPVIDTYVTDTTKKDIDAYEKEKEKALDTYTDTKKTEIDNYVTNTSKPALDKYEKDKEAELETAKNTAISEYDAHAESVLTETEDLFNALPTEKANGTELYIEDAKPCRVINTEIGGMYKQETTNGYQLLDLKDHTVNSNNIFSTITDNKITCTGSSTSTWANITSRNNITYNFSANKTYTIVINQNLLYDLKVKISKEKDIVLKAGKTNITFDLDLEVTDLYFFIQATKINTLSNVNITDLQITIYEGEYDSAKAFEPFTGNIPSPNPDYPQAIEQVEEIKYCITGKNCYDISKFNTNTQMESFSGHWIYLKENTTYTISTNIVSNPNSRDGLQPMLGNPQNQNAYIAVTTDITASSLTSKNGVGTTNHKARTVTTGETGAIFVGTRNAVTALSDMVSQGGYIQIEEGIVATECEEYKEQKVNIDLKGSKLCAISDTVKDKLLIDRNGNVALQKNVSLIALNKDNIFSQNVLSNGDILYRTTQNIINSNNNFVLCNYYRGIKNISSRTDGTIYCNNSNRNSIDIIDNNASITTVDEYKTFVENNQIEVYYTLATPEIIDLGQLPELPKTFEGINNIWAETNLGNTEIEIEYVQDVKKLLEKQAEQQNARLDNIETLLNTTQTSALLLDNMQNDLEKEVE